MTDAVARAASKVPEVTLVFWIIKIAATTLGETGGDTVTMTLNWGYLLGSALFLALLVVLVICQIAAKKFHRFLYWATIVASTTAGTTMADLSVARHRLCRRVIAVVRLRHRYARRVVLVAGVHIGRHRHHAEGRSILLGRHHFLADAWDGAGRLDGRRHRL